MQSPHEIEYILGQIKVAQNHQALASILSEIRSIYGLCNVAYHAINIPGAKTKNPILLLTYDTAWIQRYVDRNYFEIDPIVRLGERGFLPLDWSEADRSSNDCQVFFKEADSYGVGRQGFSLPVRGPSGERALFTVTSNESDEDWLKSRFLYMREFQLIALFFHDRAVQLSGLRAINIGVKLSSREAECLALVADGLHQKQIAARLGLSASAIQLYLHSAQTKLGCSSLAEAAVKAVSLELLPFPR